MTSRAGVPWIVSLAAVPTLVAATPRQVGACGGWPASLTVVVAVAVLLAVTGSFSTLSTSAVLVIVPARRGLTLMVIVALDPLPARLPTWQVTVRPLRLQVPLVVCTETK